MSGRVVEQESATALTASLVELLDSAGVVRAGVLSDSTGAFVRDVAPEARGGRVEFRRLPWGAIAIGYWYVRMPVMIYYSVGTSTGRNQPMPMSREVLYRIVESGAELLDQDTNPFGSPR